jgi:hypothetical protein
MRGLPQFEGHGVIGDSLNKEIIMFWLTMAVIVAILVYGMIKLKDYTDD